MENFTVDELKHIQQALKFYYEEWNNIKGKEYPTAVLSEDELINILKLRTNVLEEWFEKSR